MPDDTTDDPRQIIADLRRQLDERTAELEARTAERDESEAQKAALAEVLQVINSSPGDLAPVFDAILDKATQLCKADGGFFLRHQDGYYAFAAGRGLQPDFEAYLSRRDHEPIAGGPAALVAQGAPYVHIADVKDSDLFRSGEPHRRAVVDLGGARTTLTIPMRRDDVLLGTLNLGRSEVRPFTDKQIALVQNFAEQAVIAIENARLIHETREALEQQTATAEVLQVINSSPGNLTPVFDAILEKARSLCDAAHGTLTIYDGEHFRAVTMHMIPPRLGDLLRQPFSPHLGGSQQPLLQGERLVHIPDIRSSEPTTPIRQAAIEAGIRTLLMIPLHKEDALLGYITVDRFEVRPFSDKEITLLENFAAQAVIAIENARLITETREALEQQTATAEVLGVINSSPGDLKPVFAAILEKAHVLCGAEYGALLTYDGERFWPAALHGDRFASSETAQRGITPRPGFGFARLVSGERFFHIHDMAKVAAERPDDPVPRALVEVSRIRTQLGVALRRDDKLLGVITANRREVRPFAEQEIALLENFAAQAVIAMENARLLGELRERNDEIAGWNKELEDRVVAQLAEIERAGKLRRFLAPQLADLIVAQGDESILESHRREIVVVFCDLRGFTGFAERAEAEEVMELLRDYHAAMGPIVARFEGTVDHYSGDGIMVFFNDPLPTPDPAKRAIDMAVAMREAAQPLLRLWRRQGHDLGFGVGIAQGYATLGQIGFAERMDYTAIGTVTNLAARLCAEAKDGQILVARRAAVAVEDAVKLEEVGDLALKGLSQAVAVYNVV